MGSEGSISGWSAGLSRPFNLRSVAHPTPTVGGGASPSWCPHHWRRRVPRSKTTSENASVWPFRTVSGGSGCSFGTGRFPTQRDSVPCGTWRTPTGFRPKALGCAAGATQGWRQCISPSTPTGLRPLPGVRHEQSERPNPGKARGLHAPLLRRYRSLWSSCWRMVDRLKPGLLTLISRDGHGQSLGVPALAGGTSGFAIHGRVGIGHRRRFLRDNRVAGPSRVSRSIGMKAPLNGATPVGVGSLNASLYPRVAPAARP
jgi:hypothetical protein